MALSEKICGAAGGILTSAFSVSLPMYLLNSLPNHKTILLWTVWGSGVGALICGLIWVLLILRTAPPEGIRAEVQGENRGTNQAAGRDVTNNYFAHPSSERLPADPDPAKSVATERRVNLVALSVTMIECSEYMLPDTQPGELIIVLPIRNVIPLLGETCRAESVCVSIDFSWNNLPLGNVSRAFWVGHEGNEITISPQSTENVVLGRYADGRLHYYCNPRKFTRKFHQLISDEGLRGETRVAKTINLTSGKMLVEVSVFNMWRGYEYLHGTYTITPVDEGRAIQIEVMRSNENTEKGPKPWKGSARQ